MFPMASQAQAAPKLKPLAACPTGKAVGAAAASGAIPLAGSGGSSSISVPATSSFSPPADLKQSVIGVRLGTPLILPQGYGCVIMVGCSSILLLSWKSMKVAEARRDFKVPNPITHSESSMTFNCIYRALQSTLEIYPQFLFTLLTGGLEMPYFCSIGGLIWILGRYVYAKGYYSGDPRKRANGSFYIVGQSMLTIGALRFAAKRLFL